MKLSGSMKSPALIGLFVLSICAAGCGRTAVASLSKEQDKYYSNLSTLLKDQQGKFDAAIESQLEADEARRRQILQWSRELARADVLLQSGTKPKGKERLLLTKTAELDVVYQKQFADLDAAERARAKALKDLYTGLQQAALAAQKNNQALTSYLSEGKTEFALQSFDAAGAAAAASTIEARVAQLHGASEKSAQARKADEQKTQQQIDDVREVLIKALEAQSGQH